MAETPNHGYNVPDEGEQDWHEPLNENFEQYDTDIEIRDKDSNAADYEPKEGAKFFATDTERIRIGDGSRWNVLDTVGKHPNLSSIWMFPGENDPNSYIHIADSSGYARLKFFDGEFDLEMYESGAVGSRSAFTVSVDGNIRIGTEGQGDFVGIDRDEPIGQEFFGVQAPVSDGEYGGMYINTEADEGWPFYGYATNRNIRGWHFYDGSSDEWNLVVDNNNVLTIDSDGNLDAPGTKNFVQSVDTDDGEKEVVYTAAEAGTPHTEVSGVATLEDGGAEVVLPAHFGWVTSDEEPLVVQTTPYGGRAGLKVVEQSTDHLVVEDLDGEGDYEFAYTVRGTRKGQEEKEVVREPSPEATETARSAPADD